MKTLTAPGLSEAQAGSFYTIRGAGGPLGEYIAAVEKFLAEQQVGKPQEWFTTTGLEVNAYALLVKRKEIWRDDKFPDDLTFLMFPLDGLDIGRLALIRLQMGDIWFDDMIENMRILRA